MGSKIHMILILQCSTVIKNNLSQIWNQYLYDISLFSLSSSYTVLSYGTNLYIGTKQNLDKNQIEEFRELLQALSSGPLSGSKCLLPPS